MSVIIQHKRGTASQWTTLNPTLAAGETGWESDTNKFKIGTGSTAWNSLLYATLTPAQLSATYASLTANNTFTGNQIWNNSVQLGTGLNASVGFEIGYTGGSATTPYLDFHSGATAIDYDSRIIASGGNGTNGQGTLTYTAATNIFTGKLNTSGEIVSQGKIFVPGGTTIYDYAVESGGSTDTAWKKLIEVNCPSGLYTGASYRVDVVDNFDNYGIVGSSNVPQTFRFYVKITRSMGVQDGVLAAVVLGPSVNYVRVVKTSSSLYEIQVRQPDVYRVVSFMARRIVHNNTTESYNPSGKTYLGLSNGSTTGTIYVPVNDSATFSNFVVENFSQLSSNRLFVQPITGSTNATVPATIRGASGQTADLQQWQTWDGTTATTKAYVTPDGSFLTSSTLTTMGNLRVAGTASTGGGAGVIGIANAATAPASNPTGGGILFVESGVLKYRGTSGSNATIVNADGTLTAAAATVATASTGVGYMGLPQNTTTTGSYTIVAADAGKHIYSTATRTVTIPANSALALPIGTTLTFIAGVGATVTIAITTDTMYLAGPGTTGSRTLAPFGIATAVKLTSTTWIISGNGLT